MVIGALISNEGTNMWSILGVYYQSSDNLHYSYCYNLDVLATGNGWFQRNSDWSVTLRVWRCGNYYGAYVNSSQTGPGAYGPPAWVSSNEIYYGTCGPQADDGSYQSWVDGASGVQYVPYVKYPPS
jgi:hypothetical protein